MSSSTPTRRPSVPRSGAPITGPVDVAPVRDEVVLTSGGRDLLAERLRMLRDVALPERRPMLVDRERDERDVADFERLLAEAETLEHLLATARVLEPSGGPVIALGSRVLLQLARRERLTVRVVHPVEASLDDERVSVESPLSQALLGARVGDTVTVQGPAGAWRCRVLEVADGSVRATGAAS